MTFYEFGGGVGKVGGGWDRVGERRRVLVSSLLLIVMIGGWNVNDILLLNSLFSYLSTLSPDPQQRRNLASNMRGISSAIGRTHQGSLRVDLPVACGYLHSSRGRSSGLFLDDLYRQLHFQHEERKRE